MIYIEGIDDPAEMWKILQEKYSPKTQTTLLQTFREFIETKMDEALETMEQHLQKLERLKRQYEEHGEIMPETIYKGTLLSSVPETYKVVVSILESQDQLTSTKIINRLLEEYRKIAGNKDGEMKMALLTNRGQKA